MYTNKNYQTKKALKDDFNKGIKIGVYSPGPWPCPKDGKITLEGPHYPQPHKWYASATIENYIITKIS
jgi:hypothetical protein